MNYDDINEELRALIFQHIKKISITLDDDKCEKLSKISGLFINKNFNNIPQSFSLAQSEVIKNEELYISNCTNPLLESMIMSNDQTTQYIGKLMNIISIEFPNIFSMLFEILKTKLYYDEYGVLLYKGPSIDYFVYASTVLFLKKTLSKPDVEHKGIEFIKKIINGEKDDDFEFYSLNALLKTYTRNSNQDRLNDILGVLISCYENNNKEAALVNMRKLVILVLEKGLTISTTDNGAFYMPNINRIYLNNVWCSKNVILHEFYHACDHYFATRDRNDGYFNLLSRAKEHVLNNPKSEEIIENIQEKIKKMRDIGYTMYDNLMIERYGSLENAYKKFEIYIKNIIKNKQLEVLFSLYNVPLEMRKKINYDLKHNKLDIKKLARTLYELGKTSFIAQYTCATKHGNFSDIISCIFGSNVIELKNGKKINLLFAHGREYYDSYPDARLCEIMANLNVLIVLGDDKLLSLLKDLVGDELYSFIINEYNGKKLNNFLRYKKGK